MFQATRAIEDLSQAISRLGVEYAANMVTGLAMQHMFQATSDMVEIKFRQVWKASTGIAAWSTVICQRYTKLRPDLGTLAGLTHKIGVLPILSWVQEHDHLVRDSMTLDKLIDSLHPAIGTMVLQEWRFPQEIVFVPQKYQSLNHQADHSDYIDVVSIARLLSLKASDHPIDQQNWQSSPAFSRAGFDPELDELEMEEIIEEVQTLRSIFN